MRLLTLALAGVMAAWAGAALAQPAACVIYEDARFGGDSYGFSETGQSSRYSRSWDDRVSSVRVAPGCRLTLWEDPNFRGSAITFEGEVSFVGREWNDRASSSRCECDPRRPRDVLRDVLRDILPPPPDDGRGRDGGRDAGRGDGPGGIAIGNGNPPRLRRNGLACNVFRDNNFRGAWRAFRDGEDDRELGRRLNGEVSSVQVARGCVALLDIGRPYKLYVDQDTPNLGRIANDRTDSVSCFCQ